ncbi:WD repeat domain-containing protein 83 isoform X1 [Patagioenas fasciata]|uniref:WD repeat domain-containing protein 83 isoform X1 n=1 Tax=Patagioenas fasciata TaxID=372321 RepID=UPI003A99779E
MAFPQPRPVPPELPRRRLRTLECGQGAVRAVRFNADGHYCLTCGADKTLRLWNPHTGAALKSYQGHGYELRGQQPPVLGQRGPHGGAVGRGDRARAAQVPRPRGAGELCPVQRGGHGHRVGLGRRLPPLLGRALPPPGGAAGAARAQGRRHQRGRGPARHPGGLRGRARAPVRPAGRAAALRPHRQPCEQRLPQPGRSERVGRQPGLGAAAAGHAERGAAGSVSEGHPGNGDPKQSGELLAQFRGHRSGSYRLDCALSAGDAHAVAASEDGHVYLWDLLEGSLLLRLPVGPGVVASVSLHPEQPLLLAATRGQVQLWGPGGDGGDSGDSDPPGDK